MDAEKLEKIVTEAADKLVQAVETYGPKATTLVLETGRVAALQSLTPGFFWLLFSLSALPLAWWFNGKHKNWEDDGWQAAALICWASSIVSFGISYVYLTNWFAWAGLWHPEIYLTAKLLKLY